MKAMVKVRISIKSKILRRKMMASVTRNFWSMIVKIKYKSLVALIQILLMGLGFQKWHKISAEI